MDKEICEGRGWSIDRVGPILPSSRANQILGDSSPEKSYQPAEKRNNFQSGGHIE